MHKSTSIRTPSPKKFISDSEDGEFLKKPSRIKFFPHTTDMQSEENPLTSDKGPGAGLKDLLPVPATDPDDIEFGNKGAANAPEEGPTLSHALATQTQDADGLAQQPHAKDVLDLGWNEKKQDIAAPLVGGMNNEELWLLVRRFNKVSRSDHSCDCLGRFS
jgi:hypothetical protein